MYNHLDGHKPQVAQPQRALPGACTILREVNVDAYERSQLLLGRSVSIDGGLSDGDMVNLSMAVRRMCRTGPRVSDNAQLNALVRKTIKVFGPYILRETSDVPPNERKKAGTVRRRRR